MESKYKKFVDNGNGDCIYCHERRHDCRCEEETAISLGYHCDNIKVTKPLERPPMPSNLMGTEKLMFFLKNPTSRKTTVCVWRKGNQWFKIGDDLVDYYNRIGSETN